MFNGSITCIINNEGRIRHIHEGSCVSVGTASTPMDSKLIESIRYEDYIPEEMKKLIDYALLHKCMPDELVEFKVHYMG